MQIEINQISFEDKKYWIKNMFFLFRKTFFWFAAVGMFIYFLGELRMSIVTKSTIMIFIILMSFHVCQIVYENTYGKKQDFGIINFFKSNIKMLLLQIHYRFLTIFILFIFLSWAKYLDSKDNVEENVKFFRYAIEGILVGYICLSVHIKVDLSIFAPMLNREFGLINRKEVFMLCMEANNKNKGLDWLNYLIFIACVMMGILAPIGSFILLQFFIMFNYLTFREIFIGKTKIKEEVKVEIEDTEMA